MAAKSHVLVVDDDPDKLALLEVALTMAGYEVRTASDGDEALAAVNAFEPDLVVSDIMMPRMNGYELARRIRDNPQTKFILKSEPSAISQTPQTSIYFWPGPALCSISRPI